MNFDLWVASMSLHHHTSWRSRFTHLPGPDIDDHVVLVAHADDVLAVGGEGHASHAVLVLLELGNLRPLRRVPYPH